MTFSKIVRNLAPSRIGKASKLFLKILQDKMSLSEGGERVDISYGGQIAWNKLDIYQKSHYRRYEYAASLLKETDVVGDFACGTGYGSIMMSERCARVIGADIDNKVVEAVKQRYRDNDKVDFICSDILDFKYDGAFDLIVSFETLEHLTEEDIRKALGIFHRAIRTGGSLLFSTPYMQANDEAARRKGFHKTFFIDEKKIYPWLSGSGFEILTIKYQSYSSHDIVNAPGKKDFIIVLAKKS